MADPGFPVGGGVDLVGGPVDLRGGYVSKILHVKMKESGPVGGGACRVPPLDPPMVGTIHVARWNWVAFSYYFYFHNVELEPNTIQNIQSSKKKKNHD